MKVLLPRTAAVITALGFACASSAQSVPRAEDTQRVEQLAATLAQEHAPDNPEKMKRLVLFQTPVHAAAEIKRVMAAVRDNRMPRDEIGIEKELDAKTKTLLLKYGAVFESTVNAAYAWESSN